MAQKWEYTIIDLQPKSGRISDTELGKRLTLEKKAGK